MLSTEELNLYFDSHQLSHTARTYIEHVRNSPPSRRIGDGATKNVCTWFSSQKMGFSLGVESATVEGAYLLDCEYDHAVLEIWEQPEPINIRKTIKGGKKRNDSYTPDFLVLHKDGPLIVETKPESEAVALVARNPDDWAQTANGFDYHPAFSAFDALGLRFKVVALNANVVRQANISLMLQARETMPRVDAEILARCKKLLRKSAALTLTELSRQLQLEDYTSLIALIAHRRLFASINEELLSQPSSSYISLTDEIAEVLRATRSSNAAKFPSSSTESVAITSAPTERDAKHSLDRLERIHSGENSRSVRRWKLLVVKGEAEGKTPFESLLPKLSNSGNKRRRINAAVKEYLVEFLNEHWKTIARLKITKAHRSYRVRAETVHPGHPPVSRQTFQHYVQLLDPVSTARARGGNRLANSVQAPSPAKSRFIRKAVAFNYAHIDHALSKVYVVIGETLGKKYVVKLWVTLMIDVATGTVLGRYVSLLPPSRIACAMVMRDCIRRFGRLPKAIMVDRGADFVSVYFRALLASLRINLHLRPSGHPRFGSEVERFFQEAADDWWSTRKGNEVTRFASRKLSAGSTASANAQLTPADFIEELDRYLLIRDSKVDEDSAESASARFIADVKRFPFVGVTATLDQALMVQTAVDAADYKIDPARGIHYNGRHYYHPALAFCELKKVRTEVRKEPENPFIIYAKANKEWVTCTASGITEYEALNAAQKVERALIGGDGKKITRIMKEQVQDEFIREQIAIDSEREERSAITTSAVSANDFYEELFASPEAYSSESAELHVKEWSE